ncbi:MAG: DUF1080 domain-containing protein [Planctomyces sp.]|nr:DUF1080 domain-containing protein [Planctomyces sp.]
MWLRLRCRLISITSLILGLVILPMTSAFAQDQQPDPNLEAAVTAASILKTAEWRPLFNGTDLSGWTGDTAGYSAENGVLVCRKGGKNLYSEKEYSDFAFTFEFKLEESGNNGIGIRVPSGGYPSRDGMEIQILDHDGSAYHGDAVMANGQKQRLTWLKPWQFHGSVYGIYPAKIGYLKPVGEWNTETIVVIEDHIMVILNGAVIVDVFLDDVTPVDGTPHPGKDNRQGHLVLAGHDDRVEFRNLQIADYSRPPLSPDSTAVNVAPKGFQTIFNGSDLAGWKGLAHGDANQRRALSGDALVQAQITADAQMNSHWSVSDGVLTYDGKGDSLCTEKNYGDFDLYVDWKIPAGADSGIYLRGTPQIQIWDPWDPRLKEGQAFPATAEEWVGQYGNGRNLGSGGLWNNRRWRNAPTVLADRKPEEWNTFLIRMVGEKVSIWLNDKQVVDRVKLENYWDKTGLIPIPRADQIELQHHGSALYFRNLYIRELPY